MPQSETLGEVAYNAYKTARGGKFVSGKDMPEFHNQTEELAKAWEAAGKAVADQFVQDTDEAHGTPQKP